MIDQLPVLVSFLDNNLQYRFSNAAYDQWFGDISPLIRTGSLEKLFTAAQIEEIAKHRKLARSGQKTRLETTYTAPSGETKILNVHYQPFRDENGAVLGVIVLVFDITEQRESEKQIRENEAKLRRVLVDGKLAYWETDYKSLYWSDTNYELLGLPLEPRIDLERFLERIHPQDRPIFAWSHEKRAQQGLPHELEFRIRHADGSYRWFFSTANPILNEKGELVRLLGITADITEKKATEELHEAQRAKMISAARLSSLGEMAAGIAHEINNPLAIISAKTQQLIARMDEGELDPVFLSKNLLSIETTARRIASIVKGLRSFARDGECDPFEIVPVSHIIEDALSLCQARFRHHGIKLTLIDQGEQARIECRPVQISQILLNLLNNAFDAVEELPEKWVELKVETSEDRVVFRVTDSGRGIPVRIREKILQPFFTTKALGKGTGLGLSIANGIIKSHQGTLDIPETTESQPHTSFVITLPREQRSPRLSKP